jgi:hypothetical protein
MNARMYLHSPFASVSVIHDIYFTTNTLTVSWFFFTNTLHSEALYIGIIIQCHVLVKS